MNIPKEFEQWSWVAGIVSALIVAIPLVWRAATSLRHLWPVRGGVYPGGVQPAPVAHWVLRLNAFMKDEVNVFCVTQNDPSVELEGPVALTEAQAAAAAQQRLALQQAGRPNDMHAVVMNQPSWRASHLHLRVRSLDFATVRVLRQQGERPRLMSAGAVMVCSELREVLLHRRGPGSDKFASHLHTLGGGYMPPSSQGRDDGASLRTTAEREVHEETRIALPPQSQPPRLWAQELSTGFVQFYFLGFDIPAEAVQRASASWEGHLERIPFDQLRAVLERADWVPSGRAHVLAWLALGAPGAGARPRFMGQTPAQLFNALVPQLR